MGRSACRGESGLWKPVGSALKTSEVVTIDVLGHRSASASCTKVARPYHVCTYKEYLDLGLCLILPRRGYPYGCTADGDRWVSTF